MGLFDGMISDAKRKAINQINNKNKWKCRKCGNVIESEFEPRKTLVSMASDPCPKAEYAGEWHDYRRV